MCFAFGQTDERGAARKGATMSEKHDANYHADRMEKTDHTIDPENGLSCHREGEAGIPDVGVPRELEQDDRPTFPWGDRRKAYLKEHRRSLYREYVQDGTLSKHMKDVQELAQERLDAMIPRMAEKIGVNEALKREDALRWAGLMNNIKHSVEESIYEDLIYS